MGCSNSQPSPTVNVNDIELDYEPQSVRRMTSLATLGSIKRLAVAMGQAPVSHSTAATPTSKHKKQSHNKSVNGTKSLSIRVCSPAVAFGDGVVTANGNEWAWAQDLSHWSPPRRTDALLTKPPRSATESMIHLDGSRQIMRRALTEPSRARTELYFEVTVKHSNGCAALSANKKTKIRVTATGTPVPDTVVQCSCSPNAVVGFAPTSMLRGSAGKTPFGLNVATGMHNMGAGLGVRQLRRARTVGAMQHMPAAQPGDVIGCGIRQRYSNGTAIVYYTLNGELLCYWVVTTGECDKAFRPFRFGWMNALAPTVALHSGTTLQFSSPSNFVKDGYVTSIIQDVVDHGNSALVLFDALVAQLYSTTDVCATLCELARLARSMKGRDALSLQRRRGAVLAAAKLRTSARAAALRRERAVVAVRSVYATVVSSSDDNNAASKRGVGDNLWGHPRASVLFGTLLQHFNFIPAQLRQDGISLLSDDDSTPQRGAAAFEDESSASEDETPEPLSRRRTPSRCMPVTAASGGNILCVGDSAANVGGDVLTRRRRARHGAGSRQRTKQRNPTRHKNTRYQCHPLHEENGGDDVTVSVLSDSSDDNAPQHRVRGRSHTFSTIRGRRRSIEGRKDDSNRAALRVRAPSRGGARSRVSIVEPDALQVLSPRRRVALPSRGHRQRRVRRGSAGVVDTRRFFISTSSAAAVAPTASHQHRRRRS